MKKPPAWNAGGFFHNTSATAEQWRSVRATDLVTVKGYNYLP